MTREKAAAVAAEVFVLYELFGDKDYIGEPVSQVEHMLQAGVLAEKNGYDEEVVLAAFFHDVGHLVESVQQVKKMQGIGVVDHEEIGAKFLAQKGFSPRLCRLVRSHVRAKRYLTFKYPDYYSKLSAASKQTLVLQGGKMSEAEADLFEMEPDHKLILQMREWDDKAKEKNMALPPLHKYHQMAVRHLINQDIIA
jgi:phosphonate degradation associated HDIG domain protein